MDLFNLEFNPHFYQIKATEFLFDNQSGLLFADMGVGKTAIVLSLLHRLFVDRESWPGTSVLIVAPLRVCQLTWPIEIAKWDFSKHFTHTFLHGKNKRTIFDEHDIYLINYEGLAWLYEHLKVHRPPFDMVVFDEVSKLKDTSTKRFKILKKILPLFNRKIGLTGTPIPNSYMDLFGQLYAVDEGESLGKFITHFRDRFFDKSWDGFSYTLKNNAEDTIDKLIAPKVFRIESEHKIPITYIDIDTPLPSSIMSEYKELEKESFIKFDDTIVRGLNAATLLNKLRQFSGGAVYTDEGVKVLHDAKIHAVGRIKGPVIIAYAFKHELIRLIKHFPDSVNFAEGDQMETLQRWNKGEINRLLIHPASVAHGLNLQQGGHKLVWYTLTWSSEQHSQANARIWRQGQKEPVEIYYLMAPDTVDAIVKAVLESKDSQQRALLVAMSQYRVGA